MLLFRDHFFSAGALHSKVVSVYINRMGLVMLLFLNCVELFMEIQDFPLSYHGMFAGCSQNEEPACCRNNHQEEEK
jgi:hypothetical protein